MTFQTDAPLVHRSLSASNRQAREVAHLAFSGDLDVAPAYQRPSVWTEAQQIGLIRSWMLGVPIPSVTINDRGSDAWRQANGTSPVDTGDASYVAVDGKQRIETAVAWFHGDLAVPASWFAPEAVESTVETTDGLYVTYAGLNLVAQRRFANRAMLPVIEANALSVAEEADLYLLVNGAGTPQSQDDMDNAASYATEM